MRRDSVAQQTDWNLRDDSQGGRLNQFGELRADKCRSEQCIGFVVNDQFRPSFKAIPVKGEESYRTGVMSSSRPYRETFCAGLTFGAAHPGHLRVSVDNLRQIAGITSDQLVLRQFSSRGSR